MLHKVRIHIESHMFPSFIIGGIIYGLAFAFFVTKNPVFVYVLTIFAATVVGGLILLAKATNHWWYYEYDDNEWGRRRETIHELEQITSVLNHDTQEREN